MSFMPETTATSAGVRQREVEQEFVAVEETAAYIEKMVSELEDRLSRSILAQRSEDKAADSPKNPEPVRVPIAQALHEHVVRLERVRERLSSILSRLEA